MSRLQVAVNRSGEQGRTSDSSFSTQSSSSMGGGPFMMRRLADGTLRICVLSFDTCIARIRIRAVSVRAWSRGIFEGCCVQSRRRSAECDDASSVVLHRQSVGKRLPPFSPKPTWVDVR